jgi:arsenite-transporting ATPase
LFAPRQQTVFEPFIRAFAGDYASTGEEVFERGRDLLTRLARLRDQLTDPAVTSVRLVLTPDEAAVQETLEAIAVLSLFSYPVDALVLNQLLPDEVADPFFQGRRLDQARAAGELSAAAGSLPVLHLNLQPAPPRGVEALLPLAFAAYGAADPAGVLFVPAEHSFERQDGVYLLRLAVPFARRDQLKLEQADEGISVHLHGRRCVLELPEEITAREASSWSLEGGYLKVVLRG